MTMKVVYNVIDSLVAAENRGGTRSRYIGDAVTSTVALLNTSQAVSNSWSYFPYGESTRILGSTPTKLLYVGGSSCRQDNSMNTLMGHRVLDVVKGKWKTQDPIRYDSGDANMYRYCANNPTTLIDPTGTIALYAAKLPGFGNPQWKKIGHCVFYNLKCCNSIRTAIGKACADAIVSNIKDFQSWEQAAEACWPLIEDPAAFFGCVGKKIAGGAATACAKAAFAKIGQLFVTCFKRHGGTVPPLLNKLLTGAITYSSQGPYRPGGPGLAGPTCGATEPPPPANSGGSNKSRNSGGYKCGGPC